MNESLFIEYMGESPLIKVLDYMITNRELDFSITDIADNSKIGRATLYRIWENLVGNKIILHTRVIGKAKLFRLNVSDAKIKKLIELHEMLTREELKKRAVRKVEAKTKI